MSYPKERGDRRDALSELMVSPELRATCHHRKRISDATRWEEKGLMACPREEWNRVNQELNNELKEEPLKVRVRDASIKAHDALKDNDS
ncbi:hypothetical protein L2E82_19827 [Cichorium intybus]|uniref:Uncharacterized protein n=1 Tax=Cichorium intybus TaxID=13427 RepID=A0ACB9DRM6_CICIN|nr:hypothetical protein L2E82_19827 [Cichorium intybus]